MSVAPVHPADLGPRLVDRALAPVREVRAREVEPRPGDVRRDAVPPHVGPEPRPVERAHRQEPRAALAAPPAVARVEVGHLLLDHEPRMQSGGHESAAAHRPPPLLPKAATFSS